MVLSSSFQVVFVGPFEHHSNLLPWRELGATVIRVRESNVGLVDVVHLQEMLQVQLSYLSQIK